MAAKKPQDLVAYVNHRQGEKDGKPYDFRTMTAYRVVSTEPNDEGRYQDNARLNYMAGEDGGFRDRSLPIAKATYDKIAENAVVFDNPEDPNTQIAFMRAAVNYQPPREVTGKDGVTRTEPGHQYVNPKTLEPFMEDMLPEGVDSYESAKAFIYENKGRSFENAQKNKDLETPEATAAEVEDRTVEIAELDVPEVAEAEMEQDGIDF